MTKAAERWAETSFGNADLGDVRRRKRLVRMMAQMASEPAGRITRVFGTGAARQAAYDFVEHQSVSSEDVVNAVGMACARACRGHKRVLVALDGTSLSLTDRDGSKGFGSVGARSRGGRGLKVMNTLAMTEAGVVLGVPAQQYWVRGERVAPGTRRPCDERESVYWRHAVTAASERVSRCAPDTTLHFIADREADASLLMQHLAEAGHEFTIRAVGNRKVVRGHRRVNVRKALSRTPEKGRMWLHVPGHNGGPPREALLSLRVARETLILRDHHSGKQTKQEIFVVLARETGHVPKGHKRVEWMLYTTTALQSMRGVQQVLERYALRWHIEEMHRAWKTGVCDVEEMQLRSVHAATKWACMLACVASRVERLKQLSREQPDLPASTELSDSEIHILRLLKRKRAKRTEKIGNEMPSLGQAVGWIADLGGYVRNIVNGPPGSATIGRGLERLTWSVEAFDAARSDE